MITLLSILELDSSAGFLSNVEEVIDAVVADLTAFGIPAFLLCVLSGAI